MKENKKFRFNRKRLLCSIVSVVLSLCCFMSVCFASSPTDSNVIKPITPIEGTVDAKASLFLRNGSDVNLLLRSELRTTLTPLSSLDTYYGWGTNDVKSQLSNPINDRTYTSWNNSIATSRYKLVFQQDFSGESYIGGFRYPVCSSVSLPFSFYGSQIPYLLSNEVGTSAPMRVAEARFYSATVYCYVYTVSNYGKENESIVGEWLSFDFDSSSAISISDKQNPYANDYLYNAVRVNCGISFDRPVAIQQIVLDVRTKFVATDTMSSNYLNIAGEYRYNYFSGMKSLVVFDNAFLLSNYTDVNFSIFKTMGHEVNVLSIWNNSYSSLADYLKKYSNSFSNISGFDEVVQKFDNGFSTVSLVLMELFNMSLIREIVWVVCAFGVFSAIIGVAVAFRRKL